MSIDSTASSGNEALLEPSAAPAGRVRWRLGAIELDEHRLELRVKGILTPIEPKPLELLRFLLRRVGEVVTREEILAELWPGRVVTDAVVTNCVGKLRTALNDSDQLIVRTVQRFGYLLAGDVLCEPLAIPEGLQAAETTLKLMPGDPVPFRPGWQLSRRLGGGGHGEVWLAFDTASKEERVLKFCETPDDLSALKRELTLQRVLDETLGPSDYFVPLVGHNLEAAPFFLEMPFFAQGNLGEWLQSRGGVESVPMDMRLELIAQCAEAVAAAHSAGVLHKDLKPSNVLIVIDSDGKPSARLCDFGSGRMLDPDLFTLLGLTRRGFTRTLVDTDITPMYLAPEVIAGQPPTAMADIYALGIMLYQMVAGDLRRPLAPGWEADVADPMLREDISFAAAGSLRRRLSNAGQLATRLRSLAARRAEVETQRLAIAEAERLRRQLEVWQARRGLVLALVAVLMAGVAFGFFHYTQAHMGQGACPAIGSDERPLLDRNRP